MIEGLIKTTINELNLCLTLKSGQNFRYKELSENQFIVIMKNRFVIQLTQNKTNSNIDYKVLNPGVSHTSNEFIKKVNKRLKTDITVDKKSFEKFATNSDKTNDQLMDNSFYERLIQDFFRLDENLSDLYDDWSKSDEYFQSICHRFRGIRILRQYIVETIFAFICSSNNNINRISKLVQTLSQKFGHKLYESEELGVFYSFPDPLILSDIGVEQQLRDLGFGYRSKFIQRSAQMICKTDSDQWLQSLKAMPYVRARQTLMELPGVGPKVADCIALMALDHLEAIPIDTHMMAIAVNTYLPHLKSKKSLNDQTYQQIGIHLRFSSLL